jgi:hypothetical protein
MDNNAAKYSLRSGNKKQISHTFSCTDVCVCSCTFNDTEITGNFLSNEMNTTLMVKFTKNHI